MIFYNCFATKKIEVVLESFWFSGELVLGRQIENIFFFRQFVNPEITYITKGFSLALSIRPLRRKTMPNTLYVAQKGLKRFIIINN